MRKSYPQDIFVGRVQMKRRMIPQVCGVLMLFLGPLLAAAPQNEAPKPKVSNEPLTAEQVAVYRALLEDYTNGTNGTLNVANTTELPKRYEIACLIDTLDGAESSVPIVHQLDSAILLNSKIVLVDPDHQKEVARANDLRNLPMSVFDDPKVPFTQQVDDSRKRVFEALSLFTLSEIVFDKHHRRAVVTYSFVCPGLCGHGSTLVLKRVGQRWKVSQRCGEWVS